jgi:tetratricopeptide (TPR) repeat protein
VEHLRNAVGLTPTSGDYLGQLSRYLYHCGEYMEAVAAADAAMKLEPQNPSTLDTLGCVYTFLEQHVKAGECFKQVAHKIPGDYLNAYNYANAMQFQGQFDACEAALRNTLELNPSFTKAWWSLSRLRTSTPEKNNIADLEALQLRYPDNREAQTYLGFALGKEYEDLGNFDAAYANYQRGCLARRADTAYSASEDRALVNLIKATYSEAVVRSAGQGYDSAEPIFIIGMPRTGTTLLDRILASHPQISSAGELRNFRTVLKRLLVKEGKIKTGNIVDMPEAELIENSLAINCSTLGKAYIDSTRYITGGTAFYIDKLPQNYLYAGLIMLALPKAKILHLTRNPMDTCFSNFKQLFARACYYSYDLEDVAEAYYLYRELMAHWHKAFPGRILDVSYESLVENQESETQRVLEYCGLEWNESCLQFHLNPSTVATASAAQVRKPLYRSSLEKWRKFDTHLQPLKSRLEQLSSSLSAYPEVEENIKAAPSFEENL